VAGTYTSMDDSRQSHSMSHGFVRATWTEFVC
jgi:hypothetical protein